MTLCWSTRVTTGTFTESGLIDRTMHEPSMRVPLMMECPSFTRKGNSVTQMVLNIDIARTFLHWAGVALPAEFQGRSLLPFPRRKNS